MIALLQRVTEARVEVGQETVGRIGPGLLVLLAVEPADDASATERMIDRVLRYRVFDDSTGRMNLSVLDSLGGVLLVHAKAGDPGKGPPAGHARDDLPQRHPLVWQGLRALLPARRRLTSRAVAAHAGCYTCSSLD